MKPIWNLHKRDDVPLYEKICLLSTFDFAAVQHKYLPKLAQYFEEFQNELIKPIANYQNNANHLIEMAEDYRKLSEMKGIKAVCWYGTSVGENLWWHFKKERLYNFNRDGNKHWYIFQ